MFKWFENLVDPYPSQNLTKPLPKRFFAFTWQATESFRWSLLVLIILAIGAASSEALVFSYIGKLVDWASASQPKHFLQQHQQNLILLTALLIFHFICTFLQSMVRHQVFFGNLPMRMRWRFHNLLLQQSLDFFHNDFAGRLSAKIMQTALAVREFWMTLANIFVYVLIYFISINVILASISTLLMIPLLMWLVFFLGIGIFFIPRLSKVSQQQANSRSIMTGRITDAYTNIQTVKLFAHAGRESQYAKESMQEFMVSVYQQMRLATLYESSIKALSMFLFVSVIGTAVYLWTQGHAQLGIIAATTAMVLKLDSLASFIMWQMTMLFENIGVIQDGMKTLSKPVAIQDKANASELNVNQGHIQFRDVCFAYNDQTVINHFNLDIQAGEKIGIVGRSGAGKSTLIQLLLRFYQVNHGEILIDQQNINDVSQDSLRKNIALVSQDTSLLHRTVLENIQYSKPNATADEIQEAIHRAQASEFIPHLVDMYGNTGLDAYVGERGVKLSGGQRQRISIARVFLKDAPILILDEATSALDSEVEATIQQNLEQLMTGKTVIAIAHRLSTIAKMDRLIVLDQGQIIEQGTHAELISKNGLYAQLWARQSGDFLQI